MAKYIIFRTKWGYFGLAGTKKGLLRTCLPTTYQKAKSLLLNRLRVAEYDTAFFKELQKQITAYFDGSYVDFDKGIPIALNRLSSFARRVLKTCRDIPYGETITYGQLAQRAGRSGTARAVGSVMANNPLPLIIPCHRVICSNGKLGGFSAAGGLKLKKRLLLHESRPFPMGWDEQRVTETRSKKGHLVS